MPIEQVKIRARVTVGGLSVETPYVLSFNVNKQRGSLSTFNVKLKVNSSSGSFAGAGSDIKIYAGTADGGMPIIFTGIVENMQMTPVFDDPSFVNISLSGSDKLKLLAGKKFTRRCRSTKATWVTINGVVRESLKSGKFKYVKQNYFDIFDGDISTAKILRTSAQSAPKDVQTAPKSGKINLVLAVRPYSDEVV